MIQATQKIIHTTLTWNFFRTRYSFRLKMAYKFIHLLPLLGTMVNSCCARRKKAKIADFLQTSVQIPEAFQKALFFAPFSKEINILTWSPRYLCVSVCPSFSFQTKLPIISHQKLNDWNLEHETLYEERLQFYKWCKERYLYAYNYRFRQE